jgi:signal transduction histidine kinase
LAGAAVGVLLFGALSLSERRGAFVGAVTHELRTPLTTFRMYTEMLTGGMVSDEAQRKQYYATLHAEAERLGHLVENVLAYARLEKNSVAGRLETLSAAALLEKASARMKERLTQAGLELVMPDAQAQAALEASVRADPGAVEQVLFNLADNAAKYAVKAEDKRVQVDVNTAGRSVEISVSDHGPGIGAAMRRKLFQPFSKSAQEAAVTAPGVGLGLALCRRLARQMGGELSYAPGEAGGARFTLSLPKAG